MEPDKIQKASERGFSMRIILTVGHSILKSVQVQMAVHMGEYWNMPTIKPL